MTHQIYKRHVIQRLHEMDVRLAIQISPHGPEDLRITMNRINDLNISPARDDLERLANIFKTDSETLPAVRRYHDQPFAGKSRRPRNRTGIALQFSRDQTVAYI